MTPRLAASDETTDLELPAGLMGAKANTPGTTEQWTNSPVEVRLDGCHRIVVATWARALQAKTIGEASMSNA
jgi:hypothetical protein